MNKQVYVARFRKGDILVTTWNTKIERTISHSWSSDSEQPEPFVKLIFQGPVKERKEKFFGQRYDVFSEKFTPFAPNPPPSFTEIFRNTLASLFQSSQGNVRRLSDKKESPSQDGDSDKARSTADDSNPKDPEDRDRAHSDGSRDGQDSSGQDSPTYCPTEGYKFRISTDDQNFQLDPEISLINIFKNAFETVYGSSPENVQGHKDSPVQDGDSTDYPNTKDPEDRDRAHSDGSHEAQNSSHQDSGEDGGIKLCDDSHAEQNSSRDSGEVSSTEPFDEGNQSKASGMGRCSSDQDNTNEEQSSSKESEPKPSSWGIGSIFSDCGKKLLAGVASMAFVGGIGYAIYKRGCG